VPSLPDSIADTALARLFAGDDPSPEVSWFSVPGGQHLYDAGSQAEDLYFLRAGRLGVVRREEGQEPQFIGVIRPGEPVGEMGVLAGGVHHATVVALRDSEVLSIPRRAFFEAIEEDPTVMLEVARLMIQRTRANAEHMGGSEPSVFGFIGVSHGTKVRELAERLSDCIEAQGYVSVVMGVEAMAAPTEWFSNVEAEHDFVLYAAECEDEEWRQLVSRQVDRLFLVGLGDAPPPEHIRALETEPLLRQRLVDLVLVQPERAVRPKGSDAWLDAAPAARLFHLRQHHEGDLHRLARNLTGQAVGLVLSGGGARAYAHIGAIKALHAAGVPIDFVGGASMGAVVAAGLAMGWGDAELDRRIRNAFVDSSPLDDIALPLIAMTRGEKVHRRLNEHFGKIEIADLWLPFFCVSSNLTSGAYHLHRRGRLSEALRASISLPGVLPPYIQAGEVLVDGAVMKNFPADIMRAFHTGPIVGVDVTRGRSISAEDVEPESVWRWIFSGHWRRGPPIVSLLMRAATVSSGRDLAASRLATDVLVLPKLEGVDIRNWSAYDPAVDAGERAMREALDKLEQPVSALRRRLSLAERHAALRVKGAS
jgi:NTE family protein